MVSIISSNPCGILTNMTEAEVFNFTLPFPAELVDYIDPSISEFAELFSHLDCPVDAM